MFTYLKKGFFMAILMGILGLTGSTSAVSPIENQYKDAIVMFYKASCPYCRYMTPIMNQIKAQYKDKIAVVFVEISSNANAYKTQYHFRTVPTVIYFKNGKEITRHGSNNKTVTAQFVKNKIATVWGI